jgi:glycosyltransferase involved in cell wall biosynthesis
VPARSEVLPKSVDGVCRLLFIGRDWRRKGGDVAVDTVRWLRAMGIPCELTIVGSKAPASAADVAPRVYANLDKRRRRHRRTLRRLLSESHFLLLPTRAECFGVVCCEANAFALPVLATDVGGVPVEEGRNGCRLPLTAGGWDFAVRIGRVLSDPGRYGELAATARETYEKRLSWGAWAEVMESVLREAAAGRQPERRVA